MAGMDPQLLFKAKLKYHSTLQNRALNVPEVVLHSRDILLKSPEQEITIFYYKIQNSSLFLQAAIPSYSNSCLLPMTEIVFY